MEETKKTLEEMRQLIQGMGIVARSAVGTARGRSVSAPSAEPTFKDDSRTQNHLLKMLSTVQTKLEQQDRNASLDRMPPRDNTLRNMAAQEAFRNARVDRDRKRAKQEINDDEAFVRDLRLAAEEQNKPLYKNVADFIASTARFSQQLQHNLIHPDLRHKWSESSPLLRRRDVIGVTNQWQEIVDPGLAGDAFLVCNHIETAHPARLRGLTPDMIIDSTDEKLNYYFSAAVATRTRANAVFAAGVYKTGNEQKAVEQALREVLRLFVHYEIRGRALVHSAAPLPPQTLREHILQNRF